ncbi:MAG TPA: hypothetical protein VM764_06925 [Gemmatimonadaceae bacterium]|jgi:hypothetical protein|nr:hypothetical protein [Gemmatimonadaceae bacterium]
MDVTVQWDESTAESLSIARLSAVASTDTLESPSRDVITLFGSPTPESLALALAAAVEARKASHGAGALPRLDVSDVHGAIGDSAWRDHRTGEVIRREMAIPLTVLKETAADLLKEGGQAIRRVLAGLLMPDWPEGTRRSLTVQLAVAGAPRSSDMLAALREADGDNFSDEE